MLTTSEYLLIASVSPLSCAPSFGFVLLKGCFPSQRLKEHDGGPTPHTGGRNEVEHSQRIKSCADGLVVYDGSERGRLN